MTVGVTRLDDGGWSIECGPLRTRLEDGMLTVYDPFYFPVKRAIELLGGVAPSIMTLDPARYSLTSIIGALFELEEVTAETVVELATLCLDAFGTKALAHLGRGAQVTGTAKVSSSASGSVSAQRTLSSYVES